MQSNVNGMSDPEEKIMLFRSLYKGRDDVYAKRWENKNKGTNGYSPYCLNEWKSKLCIKPQGKYVACSNKAYAPLDEKVIDDHLRGRGNLVAGIYPLCLDETCYFLAIDFDDGEWKKDIYAVIDQRIVWYGSINLLSFGSAEESIMRLDSPNIANELIMSMDK